MGQFPMIAKNFGLYFCAETFSKLWEGVKITAEMDGSSVV